MLSWRQAVLLGLGLLAGAAAARQGPGRLRWSAAYLREAAVLSGLYAAWQLLLGRLVTGTRGAVGRGRWIAHLEHDLHVPSEAWFQRPFLHHPVLGRAADVYYGAAHFTVMGLFLAWLFTRHRDRYPRARAQLVLVTLAAALIQALPVAPPRLVPGLGVLDLARHFGQSVYAPGGLSDPGQLIAMPSVHVAWAAVVALSTLTATRSPGRWLGPLHLAVTGAVVVGTGNHWWMDGAASVVLLAVAAAGVSRSWRAPAGATRSPSGAPSLPRLLLPRSRSRSTRPGDAAPPGGRRSSRPAPAWPGPDRRT